MKLGDHGNAQGKNKRVVALGAGQTVTPWAAGAQKWLEQPLIDVDAINERLDAVAELKDAFLLRSEIRELLAGVYDMERIAGKITLGHVQCTGSCFSAAVSGKNAVYPQYAGLLKAPLLQRIHAETDGLEDVWTLLDQAIEEDPPLALKEGGIIKKGYHPEVDQCRLASVNGKTWLAELEAREREADGHKKPEDWL